MLTENQAREIVQDSMQAITKRASFTRGNLSLREAGLTDNQFRSLVEVITSDVTVGVPRYRHYLDPNEIAELSVATSLNDLTERVFKLSAGKLCSNPANPHPQPCCPYPDKCSQCGFLVL